ncbi:cop9 signalosome complex subunit 3 [Anaeramoeba ignava]|uniref:COP9 signalosome complex subunit 3 n=1 Tax=Anaeramoeba ignava TaxID=1746090 RepID=A0A9Q0RHL5_ANAIG|nr:cop9 signalosome complex subunit 3 [Anaeramoeba ignava]|eukprot:Anaeramoba_ignava/a608069_265.p1 GENE.a608069_265~~a608069_265.p1  ORF type:complete len:425 (+),score=112.63 a608069_265:61-1335(+)
MEKLLQQIVQLSGNQKDLDKLRKALNESKDKVLKNFQIIDGMIGQLEDSKHTLGKMFLLSMKGQSRSTNPEQYLVQLERFIPRATQNQVQIMPEWYSNCLTRMTQLAFDLKVPQRAVYPLQKGIPLLQTVPELITPSHSHFMLVCLYTRNYRAALPILENDVYDIDTKKLSITVKDVLLYYYYGGIIYGVLKRWRDATDFFEQAITVPGEALSAIVLESYKKYIFAHILAFGKAPSLPRYTSPVVVRLLKNLCKPYEEFAKAYDTHDMGQLDMCLATHNEIFEKDKNIGLAKQCAQSLIRRGIQRLTKTYIKLPLEQIAKEFNLKSAQQAEFYILDMIEKGEVFAKIDQQEGQVSFFDDPEPYNTSEMSEKLISKIKDVTNLTEKLQTLDEFIVTDLDYIRKTMDDDEEFEVQDSIVKDGVSDK